MLEQQAAEIERLRSLLKSLRSVTQEDYRHHIDAALAEQKP
jgi:hypothetical protein